MFSKKIPEWKNKGTKPSDSLLQNGYVGGYHPPANVFNWFWALVGDAITEIQSKAENNVLGVPIIPITSTDGVNYTGTLAEMETLVVGKPFVVIPDMTSTSTTAKLNLNNLGAKLIKESLSSYSSATIAPEKTNWMSKDNPLMIMYDGMSFRTVHIRQASSNLYGNVGIEKGGTGANTLDGARGNLLLAQMDAVSTDGITYTVTNDKIVSLVDGMELVIKPNMTSTSIQTKLKINTQVSKRILMSVANSSGGESPSADNWLVANVPIKVRYSATKNAWISDSFRMDASKMTGILPVANGGTGASVPEYALNNFINGGQSVTSDIDPDDLIGLADASRHIGIKAKVSDFASALVSNNLVAGVTANGTVTSENADFAEIGEWSDKNINSENRIGYFVSVSKTESGITMTKATADSDVRGVTIVNPAFSANASSDKFNDDGTLKKQYNYVAFAGFATVRDNGRCTVNERCISDNSGTAVPSNNTMGYQVIERVDDNNVLILVEPNADMLNRIKDETTILYNKIESTNQRIDDLTDSMQKKDVTLWNGKLENVGSFATLSDDVTNYDYIEIYLGGYNDEYARRYDAKNGKYIISFFNSPDDDTKIDFLTIGEIEISLQGKKMTIIRNRAVLMDVDSTTILNNAGEIKKVVGIKYGDISNGVDSTELNNAIQEVFGNEQS